jgi:hypothetical protein
VSETAQASRIAAGATNMPMLASATTQNADSNATHVHAT